MSDHYDKLTGLPITDDDILSSLDALLMRSQGRDYSPSELSTPYVREILEYADSARWCLHGLNQYLATLIRYAPCDREAADAACDADIGMIDAIDDLCENAVAAAKRLNCGTYREDTDESEYLDRMESKLRDSDAEFRALQREIFGTQDILQGVMEGMPERPTTNKSWMEAGEEWLKEALTTMEEAHEEAQLPDSAETFSISFSPNKITVSGDFASGSARDAVRALRQILLGDDSEGKGLIELAGYCEML